MLLLKRLLGVFVTSFLFMGNVYAAECSNSDKVELNKIANNVKIDYEVITEEVKFVEMTSTVEKIKINILNITDEVYVVVSNDQGMETITFSHKDTKDGEVSFVWDNISTVANFTFSVYASEKTNCYGTKLTTLHKQTPRYNDYSEMDVCNDENMKDFYLCQKYVTFTDINNEGFLDKVDSYISGKINEKGEEVKEELTFMDKVLKFLDDYKWYIIGGVAIAGGTGGYIYYRKTKKQREFGL